MDNNVTALERAFGLARSGTCTTIAEIKAALKAEGYALDQVTGPALGKQLKALIDKRRGPSSIDARPT